MHDCIAIKTGVGGGLYIEYSDGVTIILLSIFGTSNSIDIISVDIIIKLLL